MSDPKVTPTPQAVQVDVTVVPGSARLVVVAGGKYLGSVAFDVSAPEMLLALATVFQQYAAQQGSGIQVSNGAGLPGLRTT